VTDFYTGFKPRPGRPPTLARHPFDRPPRLDKYLADGQAAVQEPFVGLTTDGTVVPGLFGIEQSGVSTRPIQEAAEAFLAALDPAQRTAACLRMDSDDWRAWSNIHPFIMRHGVCIESLDDRQRERALAVLQETLSASGYALARDVMRLNYTIGEITGKWDEYGEWLYWLSIFGTPSADEPWGWQIDGHHLIVNCFVLGDQIVMTPTFLGSEPVLAVEGKYAGTRVFEAEEANGLALIQALTSEQRKQAIVGDTADYDGFAAAFRDNLRVPYAGIRYDALAGAQQGLLQRLIETYVGQMRPGHAAVKLAEVRRHLADTHFAWMGGCDDDSVFYYRVHSPVLLVEFDHQAGLALDNDQPSRNHIHTVVRTPNGNDYGKDLLRQHYERHHQAAAKARA
jgi:hypothetical protein